MHNTHATMCMLQVYWYSKKSQGRTTRSYTSIMSSNMILLFIRQRQICANTHVKLFYSSTRMHSSRTRTVRCTGCPSCHAPPPHTPPCNACSPCHADPLPCMPPLPNTHPATHTPAMQAPFGQNS